MAKQDLSAYFDKMGFIGHFENGILQDFGDSAQRSFTYWLEKYSSDPDHRYQNAVHVNYLMSLIELDSGEYVRHWDSTRWSGQKGSMSRDQLVPMICCMTLYSPYCDQLRKRKNRLAWKLLKRCGFCWNVKKIGSTEKSKLVGDWIGLSLIGLFLRSNSLATLFLPINWIIDLFFILNSMALVLTAFYDKEETGIDLNFLNIAYTQSQFFAPFNWVAKLIYIALRPQPALPGQPRVRVGHVAFNVYNCYYYRDQDPPMQYVMQGWLKDNFS
jgi:hypothetical protein